MSQCFEKLWQRKLGAGCVSVILLFSSYHKQVSAMDCASSLICGSEINEILLITAVIAVCFLLFVQSIVIICMARKLNKLRESFGKSTLSKGKFSSLPELSYRMTDPDEDITYLTRPKDSTFVNPKSRSTVTSFYNEGQEMTVIAGNHDNAEIWNLK